MPKPVEHCGVISYDDNYAPDRDTYQYGQSAVRRAKSAPRSSHTAPDVVTMDNSDDEHYGYRENSNIEARPFDGAGSWKDFIHRFEGQGQIIGHVQPWRCN